MNRLSIIAKLTAVMLCIVSCGTRPSKQFNAMSEESKSIENQINTSTECDDLQMLNFSILGLRSDLDNLIQSAEISDEEINKLEEIVTGLEATWSGKWAALDCEQVVSEDEMDTSGEEDGEYQDLGIK